VNYKNEGAKMRTTARYPRQTQHKLSAGALRK